MPFLSSLVTTFGLVLTVITKAVSAVSEGQDPLSPRTFLSRHDCCYGSGCTPEFLRRLLQGLRVRQVLGRLLVQQGSQFLGTGRDSHLAFPDDFLRRQLLPIKVFVGAAIRAQGGALERNSRE